MNYSNQTILITGGTGSFGRAFIKRLLNRSFDGTLRIYSRDEYKQHNVRREFRDDKRLRFLIGDIRDLERLGRAMKNVDLVIHAAALKHVPILEYNPFEAVKTNIIGTQNVIEAALDANVKKALLISSDKAVSPVNLYGSTKLVSEKLFVQANSYRGKVGTIFSVVRYGNVMGSRGSVIPLFVEQAKTGQITLTDERMTRFWITLEEATEFVLKSVSRMRGGEIFIPRIPVIKIIDLAKVIAPNAKIKIIGIRAGEKIHEILINEHESSRTKDFKDYYLIEPDFPWWYRIPSKQKIKKSFIYSSETNVRCLKLPEIELLVKDFNL